MTLYHFIFYFFICSAGLSAITILFIKNVFKAALLLLVCLLSLAGLYVLSFAEFLAVAQILIYAGGTLVLILFGVMLTSTISDKPLYVNHTNIFSGLLVGSGVFILLIILGYNYFPEVSYPEIYKENPINVIGQSIMISYVLPFEVIGLLLLISLIGSVSIISFTNSKKQ